MPRKWHLRLNTGALDECCPAGGRERRAALKAEHKGGSRAEYGELVHVRLVKTVQDPSYLSWEVTMSVGSIGLGILLATGLLWSTAVLFAVVPLASW